jgi:hypothetical protein
LGIELPDKERPVPIPSVGTARLIRSTHREDKRPGGLSTTRARTSTGDRRKVRLPNESPRSVATDVKTHRSVLHFGTNRSCRPRLAGVTVGPEVVS